MPHRRRKIEAITDPFWRDINNWPAVTVPDRHLEAFEARQAFIFDYFNFDLAVREVLERNEISESFAYDLLDSAFETDGMGGIRGWEGIIPYQHHGEYERLSESEAGFAGRFIKFLREHPCIEAEIEKLHLARRSKTRLPGGRTPETVTQKELHKMCLDEGVLAHEYPLCLGTGGRGGLRQFLRRIDKEKPVRSAQLDAGHDGVVNQAATKTKTTGEVRRAKFPYVQVECDAHRMDLMMVVYIADALGWVEPYLIRRAWLYVIYEYVSKAILGYHLSLSPEPGLEDFLQCLANSLSPWQPKVLTIDGLDYEDGAGLPSGVIEQCAWQSFDMIKLDNAKVHLSPWAHSQIIESVGATIALGKPAFPVARACVERFFRWLCTYGWHRIGSTTGSDPKDPRRKDPGKYAKEHKIQLFEIEQLLDVIVTKWNWEVHDGQPLYGKRSPLGYLDAFVNSSGYLPRTVNPQYRGTMPFLIQRKYPTVRGNYKKRRRPYVQVENAKYKNLVLDDAWDLIGKRIQFDLDITQAHKAPAAALSKNLSLGTLLAQPPWSSPHTLRVRRAIMSKRHRGKFELGSDAIRAYEKYKAEEAKTSTTAASAVVNVHRYDEKRNQKGSESDPIKTPQKPKIAHFEPTDSNWVSAGQTKRPGRTR